MSGVKKIDYGREADCIYDGEKYTVRDNGAIFRHAREGKRRRPLDGKWTFGTVCRQTGYLYIAGVRIHRIVATAFHGEPPAKNYVVDHIDTNRQNNRPENLRWLTRLENALNNPITRNKIEFLCGSVENFLQNPSLLNELAGVPNFKWMRSVTPEEANNCLVRLTVKSNTRKKARKLPRELESSNSFEKRAFAPLQKWEVGLAGEPGLELALTPWCAIYMWRGPTNFECCPSNFGQNRILDYYSNIKRGKVFATSEYQEFLPELKAAEAKLTDSELLLVKCIASNGKWYLVGVYLDQKSVHFIHFVLKVSENKEVIDSAFNDHWALNDLWSAAYSNQAS